MIALVWFSTFVVFLGYSSIAPFFPPQLASRGMNPLLNSVVFAAYSITYVIFSIVLSNVFIPKYGRSTSFFIAAVMELVAIGLLATLPYIPNNGLFLTVAIVARLLQGGGSSIMVSLSYTLVSLAYPDKLEILHTLLQQAITLGLAISPFAGSFFYKLIGYLGPFLFVGVMSIPPLFVPCTLINV